MVRPHLEYANSIWSPKLKRQSAAIERVQRRVTKLLYEIREWSYERRLKFVNLPSLKYRRCRGDLIQTYKIIHSIDDLKTEDFFTVRNDTNTRSMNVNLYIENCSSNSKLHSFSYRSRRYWNSLSKLTKEARDLNSFKNLLDKDPNRFISCYDMTMTTEYIGKISQVPEVKERMRRGIKRLMPRPEGSPYTYTYT